MHFIIDRDRWLRGQAETSYLHRLSDNLECCIGQGCRQLGLPKELLYFKRDVQTLTDKYADCVAYMRNLKEFILGECGVYVEREWLSEAYTINDNKDITDVDREKQLIELYQKNGHSLEFIN